MSALVLVIAVSVVGLPRAACAAGDQDIGVSPHRVLTFNGRPLSRFVGMTDTPGVIFPQVGLLQQEGGQINGVALDGDGQPVADGTVQLRQVPGQGGLPVTQVTDKTTTDPYGRFSFGALGRGRYLVDLRIEGHVVRQGLFQSRVWIVSLQRTCVRWRRRWAQHTGRSWGSCSACRSSGRRVRRVPLVKRTMQLDALTS